jgi:hypothetical protein
VFYTINILCHILHFYKFNYFGAQGQHRPGMDVHKKIDGPRGQPALQETVGRGASLLISLLFGIQSHRALHVGVWVEYGTIVTKTIA